MGVHPASEMGIARVPGVAGALVCLCNGYPPSGRQRTCLGSCRSIEPKIDLNVDLYSYRFAVFQRRLEAPAFHRFDRLLVEATTQLTANPDATGLTIRPNDLTKAPRFPGTSPGGPHPSIRDRERTAPAAA